MQFPHYYFFFWLVLVPLASSFLSSQPRRGQARLRGQEIILIGTIVQFLRSPAWPRTRVEAGHSMRTIKTGMLARYPGPRTLQETLVCPWQNPKPTLPALTSQSLLPTQKYFNDFLFPAIALNWKASSYPSSPSALAPKCDPNILRSESQDRPEFKFWLSHLLTSRSWASHFISSSVSTFMWSFWYRGRPMVNMSICYGYYSFKSLHLSILARPVYIPFPLIWHPYTFNPCYALYLECPISLLVQIPYPTLFQLGLLKLLQVRAPCMDDPSSWWASSGGSLSGGGGVAQ